MHQRLINAVADIELPLTGTLDDLTIEFENILIEKALKEAKGSVANAAKLLGIKHYQSLAWRLKNRNKGAASCRKPAIRRCKSIMRK